MAENLHKVPKKSILRQNTPHQDSVERRKSSDEHNKSFHWDEMNIMATHHPADKDYGHMKIDEPKTPYHADGDSDAGTSEQEAEVAPDELMARLEGMRTANSSGNVRAKLAARGAGAGSGASDSEECEEPMSSEHKRQFEEKRKHHYDEGKMMRKARELAQRDLEEADMRD